jgi:hypothetical protein
VAFDTIGEFMKSLFCRPYGTDPGVYMSLIPAEMEFHELIG